MQSLRHVRSKPLQRDIELDFVRGLAILLVLDFHSPVSPLHRVCRALGFPDHLGWIGVDIFFVLSGFLVGGLLMKEWKIQRGIDPKRFLIRRAFKIWPQYYVYLGVLLATGHYRVSQLAGNLLNVQNYMGGVAHTWSLAVEEHAYLLLLGAMVIASRRRSSTRGLFYSLLAACLLEIPVRFLLVFTGHPIFLPTHARLDSIGYGVLLAMLFHFAPAQFERIRAATPVWICVLLLSLLDLRGHDLQPAWFAVQHEAATLVAVCTLMLLYRPASGGKRHSRPYRLVAWVGLYSYGIYLWHIAVIHPCMLLMAHFPRVPAWGGTLPIWCTAIGWGVLTTELCEAPALRVRDRFFPRRVDSAVGLPVLTETKPVLPALT